MADPGSGVVKLSTENEQDHLQVVLAMNQQQKKLKIPQAKIPYHYKPQIKPTSPNQ